MASGNIYWRNLDQSTYNGDLNDEYCEEMTLVKRGEGVILPMSMKMKGSITDPQQNQMLMALMGN